MCSPLNSLATSKILRRYKDLQHAKILLIDIIGSVFNTENEIYTYNKYHNIFVLTILSENFKKLLNTTFTSDFSHYYNLDQEFLNETLNLNNQTSIVDNVTSDIQDPEFWFNETELHYINENVCNLTSFLKNETMKNLYKNQSLCETKLIHFCSITIDISPIALKMKIKQLCHVISNTTETINDNKYYVTSSSNNTNKSFISDNNRNSGTTNDVINPSTNHIIFSEYFNLFNYIIHMVTDTDNNNNDNINKNNISDEKSINQSQQQYQFDFVILDFKRILNQANESIIIWRPFLILQQNQMKQDQFTMHTIITDYFDRIIAAPDLTCGIWCWVVIAIAVILLVLIIFFSILIGIAVR